MSANFSDVAAPGTAAGFVSAPGASLPQAPDASAATDPGWRSGPSLWIAGAVCAAVLGYVFDDGIGELLFIWGARDEYNHGYLIPLISLFLVWRVRADLAQLEFTGSWAGVALCLASLGVFVAGELAAIYALLHYAMLGFIGGLVLALVGWRGIRLLWPAIVFLAFMVPLPIFLYQKLSAVLQLWSSELGVQVIRLFGISVFLEGNIIDLGVYKLQVVEACNGLRYLFPLMSFGFLCAYLFTAPFWQRALVFLSTIPITVIMNSFRIGVIGVLVEHWGTSMAEGFLHDFEGWAVFMVCVGILLLEMWLLTRLTGRGKQLAEVFGFDFGDDPPAATGARRRGMNASFVAAMAVLVPAVALVTVFGDRVENVPERKEFTAFPTNVGDWAGRAGRLSSPILAALKLDDYALVDYRNGAGDYINFYSAWYDSQRTGQSAHSPASCIPGGGWRIAEIRAVDANTQVHGQPLKVNRVLISKGEQRQLVYYWFQQRGRLITNEYLYKAMLVYDSMVMQRTDGALVRLVTPLLPGEALTDGDARLQDFLGQVVQPLEASVPA